MIKKYLPESIPFLGILLAGMIILIGLSCNSQPPASRTTMEQLDELDETHGKVKGRFWRSAVFAVGAMAAAPTMLPVAVVCGFIAVEQQIGNFHARNKHRRLTNEMLRKLN